MCVCLSGVFGYIMTNIVITNGVTFGLETGATVVGDDMSGPAIKNYLGARKTTMLGNNL